MNPFKLGENWIRKSTLLGILFYIFLCSLLIGAFLGLFYAAVWLFRVAWNHAAPLFHGPVITTSQAFFLLVVISFIGSILGLRSKD